MIRTLLLLLLLALPAQALTGRQEIVLVIVDDVAPAAIGAYGETDAVEGPYTTTIIDTLAEYGQMYLNFTSEPMCSPSRRNIWYGMNPLQHGAGRALSTTERVGVPWSERLSLVHSMQAAGYQVGIVGKHHIQDFGEGALHGTSVTQAAAMGFDFVSSYMQTNPAEEYPPTTGSPHADGNHHYSWIETNPTTGATSVNTGYTTDVFTASAVAELQDNSNMAPMFLVVAYSAAHLPFNPPPDDIGGCAAAQSSTASACYGSAIRYVSVKLEDIMDELDWDEDTMIFISENGRPNTAISVEHCSGSMSKGHATPCGTRVPMLIRGPGVSAGDVVPALVNIADLHDTLLDMVGAPQYGTESISFKDCFADPDCAPRLVGSAVMYKPAGLPVPPEEGDDFSKYEMHFLIENAAGTVLYGMNRTYTANEVGTFVDVLYNLGDPDVIDETKRYGQDSQIIEEPAGEELTARTAMQAEATRIVAARWSGPPQSMVGVTAVGVTH